MRRHLTYSVGKRLLNNLITNHPINISQLRFRYNEFYWPYMELDRICGVVVRVPGYRFRGRGFDSRRYYIFWEVVGLERGPLSLVGIIEELLERKVAAPV
jgi:hypothetical protein